MSDQAHETIESPLEREKHVGEDVGDATPQGAKERAKTLSGGHDPSEMARLANASRRAKKAAREASADLDRLAVQARVSVALARKLTYGELELVVAALLREAKAGKVQHAKLLLDYIRLLSPDESDEDTDLVDPRKLTRQQRAAVRAVLLGEVEQAGDEDVPTTDIESMRTNTGVAESLGDGAGRPAKA